MARDQPSGVLRYWDVPQEWTGLVRDVIVYDYGSSSIPHTYESLGLEIQACFAQRLYKTLQVPRLESMLQSVSRKVGDGVSELKCKKARAYYGLRLGMKRETICLLSVIAEKNTQEKRDIQYAKELYQRMTACNTWAVRGGDSE